MLQEARLPTQIKEATPEPEPAPNRTSAVHIHDHTSERALAHQMPGASPGGGAVDQSITGQTQKLPWPISPGRFPKNYLQVLF